MPGFNPTKEQEAVLAHNPKKHGRVLAGPGTGKSATIVALIQELSARPKPPRVKLLTFTRAATAELAAKLSEHTAELIHSPSTIHSFAISILLRNPGVSGFPKPLRIADDWEHEKVVLRTLRDQSDFSLTDIRGLFREFEANWQSLDPDKKSKFSSEQKAAFLGTWQEHRKRFGYTLLQELPYRLLKALESHDDLEGTKLDLLIVDEYQDLNACDLGVLELLASGGCKVLAAGDDDQSIYKFREADPAGIRNFLDDYPKAKDYCLSISMRCAKRIIEWANFVIKGDPSRPSDRALVKTASSAPSGDVALLAFSTAGLEAKGIAKIVKKLIKVEKLKPSDILILLRRDRHQMFSTPIRKELTKLNIPYSDPSEVKAILSDTRNRQFLSLLRLLVDNSDSLAWASLIELRKGLNASEFLGYLYDRASNNSSSIAEAMLRGYKKEFPKAPGNTAQAAAKLISEVIEWLDENENPQERPAQGWTDLC